MEMTIKQLADELGTNKMTIHRVINKLGLQGQLHKIDNRYMISPNQAEQIRSIVLNTPNEIERNVSNQAEENVSETYKTQFKTMKNKDKSYQMKSNETYQSNQDLQLSILNEQLAVKDNQDEQIKLLQQQLIAKDNQIGQITAAMESMATALTAEQALHAGTIQKQLAEHSIMEEVETEQPKQKQSIFSRFFAKKANSDGQ